MEKFANRLQGAIFSAYLNWKKIFVTKFLQIFPSNCEILKNSAVEFSRNFDFSEFS